MTKRQAERYHYIMTALENLGFDRDEAEALIKAERTISRWNERECNGEVEIDENNEQAIRVWYDNGGTGKRHWCQIPNLYDGARKRVEKIISKHPGCKAYFQGDPRGCSLYVIRPGDVRDGDDVNSVYTRGIALCLD